MPDAVKLALIVFGVCCALHAIVAVVRWRLRTRLISVSVRDEQRRLDAILEGRNPDHAAPRIGSGRELVDV